jgi:hypothetical protein
VKAVKQGEKDFLTRRILESTGEPKFSVAKLRCVVDLLAFSRSRRAALNMCTANLLIFPHRCGFFALSLRHHRVTFVRIFFLVLFHVLTLFVRWNVYSDPEESGNVFIA